MQEEEEDKSPPSIDDSPQQNEQLNPPSTDESIAPAAETSTEVEQSEIPPSSGTEQPQTINFKSETEDMEVHHHTHHEHGKRNWKSYFWEFLMLFLAVFCGFLAEYQLEHVIENQREKKYVRLLLSDLKTDSAFFMKLSAALDSNITTHEKFEKTMSSGSPTDYDIVSGYMNLLSTYSMRSTATTYSEMKSSGSFRYLDNEELVSQIKKYYEEVLAFLKTNEEMSYDFFRTHIQPFTLSHFRVTDIDFANAKLLTSTPVFLNRNKETEIQLMNIMGMYKLYLEIYRERAVSPAIITVNQIIELLKKEYHLK
jgi:hypothetical protein